MQMIPVIDHPNPFGTRTLWIRGYQRSRAVREAGHDHGEAREHCWQHAHSQEGKAERSGRSCPTKGGSGVHRKTFGVAL